jgi:hypothetical protein
MIFAGYGKYFRDGGDTCMTDEYGKFKYHYCKEAGGGADVCKETPPQQVTKPNHLPRAKPNHLPHAKTKPSAACQTKHLNRAKYKTICLVPNQTICVVLNKTICLMPNPYM